jgi:acetyl-CoA acyltransferase
MRDVVIVSAVRTAVGRAPSGALHTVRPDELAACVLAEALRRAPGLDAIEIEDVILGCAMPEAEQGLNVARIASLRAGLPVSVSAVTVNRFCASGLQAIAFAADRIAAGAADVILAGGTESMSLIPMGGHVVSPNPALVDGYPDVYLSTGLVAENHAREAAITRDAQDALIALRAASSSGTLWHGDHVCRRRDGSRGRVRTILMLTRTEVWVAKGGYEPR